MRKFQYDDEYFNAITANVFLYFSDKEEEEAYSRIVQKRH